MAARAEREHLDGLLGGITSDLRWLGQAPFVGQRSFYSTWCGPSLFDHPVVFIEGEREHLGAGADVGRSAESTFFRIQCSSQSALVFVWRLQNLGGVAALDSVEFTSPFFLDCFGSVSPK